MDAVGWVEHDYVDDLRAIVLIAGSLICPSATYAGAVVALGRSRN